MAAALAPPSGLLRSTTTTTGFTRPPFLRSRSLSLACNSGGGGCCGGESSRSHSEGGGCSSHGKNSLSNLGKEFEHLVATNTLLEFEKEYISAPMEGNITREIINDVKDTYPEVSAGGEKFLDINEILEEAKNMSEGDFIFSEDADFVLV